MLKPAKWHVPAPITHLLIWLFIFFVLGILLPALVASTPHYAHYWAVVLLLAIFVPFYVNYSFLIPKYLYKKRIALYIIINLAVFMALSYSIYLWRTHAMQMDLLKYHVEEFKISYWIVKSFMNFLFVSIIAVAVSSTSIWFKSRAEIQKLELENLHSELLFLKMQISPHFLFNTLNNILALIDENAELAKQSVQQLSKMLRSILYESESDTMTIKQEVELLTNYSALMKLRYGADLKFKLETDLSEPNAPIASLLLMPLVENVFKHGIGSSLEDSSINIKIVSEKGKIIFESSNTYFPKTNQDKSGSGIGIANTQKRLALFYEGRYNYDCKIADGKYITKLEINFDSNN
ncbi:MAG: histidine kinase [Fibromonadaceae bacterium]|jgi:sensor histidine kinase YesM|nr:histidine kinase [Fibromonadaceae bacterium]